MKQEVFQTVDAQYGTITTPYTVNLTDVAAQIRAAVPNRLVVILKNLDTADAIGIGVANTVTYAGAPLRLEAGESVTLVGYTGALWGICDTGDTATVSVWEGTIA